MGALFVMGVLTTPLMILCSLASIGITTIQARSLGDNEIEAHLNRLNKPAVKSITLKDGDIVDCIDIYKQLAFDHPRLKNHKIQMLPSFKPKKRNNNETHMQPLWKETEGCPHGTIPVRRVQKNDIIRASSLQEFGKLDTNGGHEESAGMRLADWHTSYHGARADLNVWEPRVEKNEWSSASLEVSLASPEYPFLLQAGWMVNPGTLGDGKTRLFAYWTNKSYDGGIGVTGCLNILCPGFVQVSTKYVLGAQLAPISVAGGRQRVIDTAIHKDEGENKWWLQIGGEDIGYWPKELFNDDFEIVAMVRWIGSVLNMNNGGKHTTTQMGNGIRGGNSPGWAAYIHNAQVMNTVNSYEYGNIQYFTDNGDCYVAAPTGRDEEKFMTYGGACD